MTPTEFWTVIITSVCVSAPITVAVELITAHRKRRAHAPANGADR